jgi:hypothetical protein
MKQFVYGDRVEVVRGFYKGVKGAAIAAKTSTNYGTTAVQELQLDVLPMGIMVPAFDCELLHEAP